MMPPADRPRSSSLDRATRQQLDELDALMQRMLALPVDPPEELADFPTESAPDENCSEETSALAQISPAMDLETPVSIPEPNTSVPVLALPIREALAAPPTEVGQPPPSPRASQEKGDRPRVAWPLYPLVWINGGFDLATAWLGPLGRWLRSPSGRALFGWGGVFLLAAALAWFAVDTLGWTW